MSSSHRDIYASAPLRGLREAGQRALQPRLQRCAGRMGLYLGVAAEDVPPTLPMLSGWARLWFEPNRGEYRGDLRAARDEPLPFLDDSFELVHISHVHERVPLSTGLLDECVRVLAPGGTLVVCGLHPFSGWLPWWLRHGRGRLQLPWQLQTQLERQGVRIEYLSRVGPAWPGTNRHVAGNLLGGGYVLMARKRVGGVTVLRLKPAATAVPVQRSLSPGIRRSAAS